MQLFSGKPLDFGNVFTAFAVPLLGLFLSVCFFLLEMITSKFGCCKKAINAYNYKIDTFEVDKATQTKAQELVGEISELLNTSSTEDIKVFLSYLRKSAFTSHLVKFQNKYGNFVPKNTYDLNQSEQ